MDQENKPSQQSRSFKFNYKEVVEALIKAKGIEEGIWSLGFQIMQKATTLNQNGQDIPVALNMIIAVTLSRVAEENNLSVDASKVGNRIVSIH